MVLPQRRPVPRKRGSGSKAKATPTVKVWTPPAQKKRVGGVPPSSPKQNGPVVWVPPTVLPPITKSLQDDMPHVMGDGLPLTLGSGNVYPSRVVDAERLTPPTRAIVEEFAKSYTAVGVLKKAFRCDDPNCVGIAVEGKVFHVWTCSWWDRPENKDLSPF